MATAASTAASASASRNRGTVSNPNKVTNPMYGLGSGDGTPKAETMGGGKSKSMEQKLAKYEEIFNRYDADGSGTIEARELGQVMRDLGHEMTAEELDTMVAAIDQDGSGEIDFEEFMQAITGKMSKMFADMNKQLEEQVFGSEVRSQHGSVARQRCTDK